MHPNAGGLSRKHILQAIDDSLRRLGMDYVDLYQIHRFDHGHADRRNARSAARCREGGQGALSSARRACTRGSLRRCSTRSGMHGWAQFVSMQNHYNLIYREEEREMNPLCRCARGSA